MFEKLKSLICPGKLTEKDQFFFKLYNKAQKIINDKIDIVNYLKFLNEYIYLKCILFNEFQAMSLSYIEKPKIYEKNRFTHNHAKDIKKITEIAFYFKNNQMTHSDEKIYEMLSDYIKDLIR